jgi:hypothetical protein
MMTRRLKGILQAYWQQVSASTQQEAGATNVCLQLAGPQNSSWWCE